MGLIRVLLALGVASAHTALPIPGFGVVPFSGYGAFDVSGFFTISGFYMALILDRKYLPLRNGLWLFYSNRIYRLLPAFAIVSGLSALMAYTSNQTSMLAWSHPLSVTLDRYSHLGLLWKIIIPIANTTYLFSDVLIWSAFLPNGTWTIDVAAPGAIAGSAFLLFPPGWSLSIELVFYLAAPLIVRLRCIWIGALALVSVLLRVWMFKHG